MDIAYRNILWIKMFIKIKCRIQVRMLHRFNEDKCISIHVQYLFNVENDIVTTPTFIEETFIFCICRIHRFWISNIKHALWHNVSQRYDFYMIIWLQLYNSCRRFCRLLILNEMQKQILRCCHMQWKWEIKCE